MADPRDPINPPTPETDADADGGDDRIDEAMVEGVRQQRRHIEDLDGEDPLRGGVAD